MKLNIGYFYADELNLYGDTGNVEILQYRAKVRGYDAEIYKVGIGDAAILPEINLLFMGGGPDSGQKNMYEDLINVKAGFLKNYVEGGGAGLFICGSYQLLGHYYKSADGSVLKGLGLLDFYTESFGNHKPRCIGNVYCEINPLLRHDIVFNENNKIGSSLVGFENHGGRTYLGPEMSSLATVVNGYGNNGEDRTEGIVYKNIIGSYLHGPLLSKNPHIADYLIAKALKLDVLQELDDTVILQAHTASKKLKQ